LRERRGTREGDLRLLTTAGHPDRRVDALDAARVRRRRCSLVNTSSSSTVRIVTRSRLPDMPPGGVTHRAIVR
jgi:hypothetical protein